MRSTTVTVNGAPLHTVVSTSAFPAPGVPLVLVHGLALSGRYMLPTGERLVRDLPVYVPDLPGFGDSVKPARILDVAGLADALAGWMQASGIPRAMFLGNSFGCQIIADFAARYPARVERAVLQGPTTPPQERSWLQQFIRWQQNSKYNPPEMGEIAAADYRKCGLVRALITFEFSLRDRIEDKLPRIAAPVLVVRGALDPICRADWAEQVARLLPRGQLATIPDAAHTLVYTAPGELAEVCRPFLKS